MKSKIKSQLKKYHEIKQAENDAEAKVAELYDAALKLAQAGIGQANSTNSVDDRIKALADSLQAMLDLILDSRNKIRDRNRDLQTKIDTIEEVLGMLDENVPTEKKTEE